MHFFTTWREFLPNRLISKGMGWFTHLTWPWLRTWGIARFIRKYNVDMSIAAHEDITSYPHFDAFFTRALRAGARPIASEPDTLVYPADGFVSEFGSIQKGQLYQAKGHHYSLLELLANQSDWAKIFEQGQFATLYLSPRDYHRVHMPETGELLSMCYVPGHFFSVNGFAVENIPHLFARNERVIALFKTERSHMAVILVGALCVASIETAWAGIVAPPVLRKVQRTDYPAGYKTLARGDEVGRFHMGSTVIVLWSESEIIWDDSMKKDAVTVMGQRIAINPPLS